MDLPSVPSARLWRVMGEEWKVLWLRPQARNPMEYHLVRAMALVGQLASAKAAASDSSSEASLSSACAQPFSFIENNCGQQQAQNPQPQQSPVTS